MSINSFMFKRIMMWVITVFLVLCLVHNLFSVKPEINGDALNETYVDMKKAGIVDPTKVTRSALQNAASIASMVLTTESLVADKPEEKGCGCSGHNDMQAGMDGMY